MMGEKQLSEIRAELRAAYAKVPGGPHAWFKREIEAARKDPARDVKFLEALYALFEEEEPKGRPIKARKPKPRPRAKKS